MHKSDKIVTELRTFKAFRAQLSIGDADDRAENECLRHLSRVSNIKD